MVSAQNNKNIVVSCLCFLNDMDLYIEIGEVRMRGKFALLLYYFTTFKLISVLSGQRDAVFQDSINVLSNHT